MAATTVRYVVPCLEGWLNAWEDFWYLTELYERLRARKEQHAFVAERALAHWRELRPFLLQIHGISDLDERTRRLEDFMPPESLCDRPGWLTTFSRIAWFSQPLAEWSWRSRRVYRISSDLQAVLGATSLEGVRWKDVSAPFGCFAIELERPIVLDDLPGERFSFILVDCPDGNYGFTLFNSGYDSYVPLSRFAKGRLEERLERRSVESMLHNLVPRFQCIGVDFQQEHEEERVLDTAARWAEATRRRYESDPQLFPILRRRIAEPSVMLLNQLCRIVAGMCLYLKSLPPGSRHVSSFRRPNRTGSPDRKAITDGSEVCTVGSVYTLNERERVMMGATGTTAERARYELSWHFREGHWRRAPGQGHMPDAAKTVHVRPTIVRKDRRPEDGGLPAGAEEVH